MIKLVVINEHSLGYILPHSPERAGILHASVLKGSPYCWQRGPVTITGENVRLASPRDFDAYRVSFTGYDNPQEYEYSANIQI